MKLPRADGGHAVKFGDWGETGTAAATAAPELAVHADEKHEKKIASRDLHEVCNDRSHQLQTSNTNEHVIPARKHASTLRQDERKISAGSNCDSLQYIRVCSWRLAVCVCGLTFSPFGMLIWTGAGEKGERVPMPS